jgi:hypothetical protein
MTFSVHTAQRHFPGSTPSELRVQRSEKGPGRLTVEIRPQV